MSGVFISFYAHIHNVMLIEIFFSVIMVYTDKVLGFSLVFSLTRHV